MRILSYSLVTSIQIAASLMMASCGEQSKSVSVQLSSDSSSYDKSALDLLIKEREEKYQS